MSVLDARGRALGIIKDQMSGRYSLLSTAHPRAVTLGHSLPQDVTKHFLSKIMRNQNSVALFL